MSDDKEKRPTLDETYARMAEVTDEIERLGKRPEMDDQDFARFDELTGEFDRLDGLRRELEKEQQLARVRAAYNTAQTHARGGARIEAGSPGRVDDSNDYDVDPMTDSRSAEDVPRGKRNPWDLTNLRTYGRSPEAVSAEYRARARDAVGMMRGASDNLRATATDILERWDDEDGTIARYTLVASDPAYMRAWTKLARTSGIGADLTEDERRAVTNVQQVQRAMSLTQNAGGYLLPTQLDPTVIITSTGSVNPIRQLSRKVIATSSVWYGVSAAAVAWSWDSEAAEVSDDAPAFAQPSVSVFMARGFVPISREALQDETNVTAEVGRLLAFGKDSLEATAFTTGTGSGQPKGIVTALAAVSGSIVASITTDTLAIGDLYALQGSLPGRYQPNASFVANNLVLNKFRQFDTSGGAGLWTQLGQGTPAQLLGKPVYAAEAVDGTITATSDNYIAVYGDFDNYVIADRLGVTVDFIPHLFGTNHRPTYQSGWAAYYRTGADTVNADAFRLLNVT